MDSGERYTEGACKAKCEAEQKGPTAAAACEEANQQSE